MKDSREGGGMRQPGYYKKRNVEAEGGRLQPKSHEKGGFPTHITGKANAAKLYMYPRILNQI